MWRNILSLAFFAFLFPCILFGQDNSTGRQGDQNQSEKKVRHTIITPILDCSIPNQTNVLWTSSFQLAWNELCKINGGGIKFDQPSSLAAALNKQEFTTKDISDDACVALGGFINKGIEEKIRSALKAKFGDQARPLLLNDLPETGIIAYSYIYKNLLFKYPFMRFYRHMRFQGLLVDCFGIELYNQSIDMKMQMASQVYILDYKSNDDFIIELKTKSQNDRLILAKVKPQKTLRGTINAVNKRISKSSPEQLHEGHALNIPVIKFALGRRYRELLGKVIKSENPKMDGQPVLRATQLIHFKLDEKGAVMKSEVCCALGGGPAKWYYFDKPFLVLLQQKEKNHKPGVSPKIKPYFALWVGNSAMLQSTKIKKIDWSKWPQP